MQRAALASLSPVVANEAVNGGQTRRLIAGHHNQPSAAGMAGDQRHPSSADGIVRGARAPHECRLALINGRGGANATGQDVEPGSEIFNLASIGCRVGPTSPRREATPSTRSLRSPICVRLAIEAIPQHRGSGSKTRMHRFVSSRNRSIRMRRAPGSRLLGGHWLVDGKESSQPALAGTMTRRAPSRRMVTSLTPSGKAKRLSAAGPPATGWTGNSFVRVIAFSPRPEIWATQGEMSMVYPTG